MNSPMYRQLLSLDNLLFCFKKIKKESAWKDETQRYEEYLMSNLSNLLKRLITMTYEPSPPRGFFLSERGKPRYIESRCIDDRIVQCAIHTFIIEPCIRRFLIYDNSASLLNRGTGHFRNRLIRNLNEYARHNGNDGYILTLDFLKFFDNIGFEEYLTQLDYYIPCKASMELIRRIVYSGAIDVSYMTNEEYANCMNTPFNNLDYRLKVFNKEYKCTKEKFMYKGMPLGSQIGQDAGILVPHFIDDFIKIVCGLRYYARYMDDSYIIHQDKDYLWNLLSEHISPMASSHGIYVHPRKTQIISLKHEFTLLQTRYRLLDNGKILIMPNNDSFERECKKLKAQHRDLINGVSNITFEDINRAYEGWRGSVITLSDDKLTDGLRSVDKVYISLFGKFMKDKEIEYYYDEYDYFRPDSEII